MTPGRVCGAGTSGFPAPHEACEDGALAEEAQGGQLRPERPELGLVALEDGIRTRRGG